VITTFKLDDAITLGESAGQADGRHGGFRSGADEAHHLHARHGFDDEFGELGFAGSGSAETGAVARGALDRCDDFWMRVPEDERSPGADVVDVLVAVGVPHAGARTSNNDGRIAADRFEGARGRIDSTGDHALGALLQRTGFGKVERQTPKSTTEAQRHRGAQRALTR